MKPKRWLLVALVVLLGAPVYVGPTVSHAAWEVDTLVTGGDVGRYCQASVDSAGNLHVIYLRDDTQQVFARSRLSGVWQSPELVDSSGGVYGFCSIDAAGAGIRRAVWRLASGSLLYAGPEAIRNWEFGEIAAGPDDVGRYVSAHRTPSGVVSVSCQNATRGALLFSVRDTLGAWGPVDTVDAGPNRGIQSDHTYRSGVGYAFSQRDDATPSILYADPEFRSHNWKIDMVRSSGDAGRYVSAKVMPDGHVACSFYRYAPETAGSVEVAFNVGTSDYWVVRAVADSVATTAGEHVSPDLVITEGWQGYVSFRHALQDQLYYAFNDSVTTGVGDDRHPRRVGPAFALRPNYPNPFNPSTTISYTVRQVGNVRLAIYDVSGRLVRLLVNGPRPAGDYRVTWDGTNDGGEPAASGVYFVRLSSRGAHRAQKLVLVK